MQETWEIVHILFTSVNIQRRIKLLLHQRYLKSKQIIVLLFSAAQLWCLCYQKWTVFRIQVSLLQNQVFVHLINF